MTTASKLDTALPVPPEAKSMEDIVALCKRRGFVYPASEIYGGINGFWDFGPLGVQLKNNIRDHWWKLMVETPPLGPDGDPLQLVGLDSAIIQNPKTWEASGHLAGFSDPMVDDKETKSRYRADHVLVMQPKDQMGMAFAYMAGDEDEAHEAIKRQAKRNFDDFEIVPLLSLNVEAYANIVAPGVEKSGTLTQPRQFNLMFLTYVGALQSEEAKAYLRPETAQGIFLNYKNVLDTMRVKVPFGVAQIGKAFRNEVTPRNFIFRSREFEQMEMEWFCPPEDAATWYDFWKHERMNWWKSLGIAAGNLRFRDHDEDELAHYSKMCVDIEYQYPFTAPGFGELEGIAHRGDFDLTQHQAHSGQRLDYFDQERQVALQKQGVDKGEIKKQSRYVPNVIEPASGLTRAVLVLLCEAYTPDESRPSKMYMRFDPKFAPVKAGVFPLVNKDGMPEVARKLYMQLRERWMCRYDAKQSIGKRYARMDEAGTPFCVTIDGQTLEDQTVTIRDRDTQAQQRVGLDQVEPFLSDRIGR